MIKTFHEAPVSLFKTVQSMTGGDYALVHLLEHGCEYEALMREAVQEGRTVYLDNSIFELGEAFDMERFLFWINRLNPTYYIVPDVLEDADGTIKNMQRWLRDFKPRVTGNSKMIGVVQGKTMEDIRKCYIYMDKGADVDMIAISFDYSLYLQMTPHPNKLMSYAMGRVAVLSQLAKEGTINTGRPHHLLGCATPGEGLFYNSEDFPWIYSVDTSNPVMHGMKGIPYKGPFGLTIKVKDKMCDYIEHWKDETPDSRKTRCVRNNITAFDNIWNGNYGVVSKKFQESI